MPAVQFDEARAGPCASESRLIAHVADGEGNAVAILYHDTVPAIALRADEKHGWLAIEYEDAGE